MNALVACLVALPLAGLATAPASAQDEAADMQQITIRIPADATTEQKDAQLRAFADATAGIRSCNQIEAAARRVNGAVLARPQVSLVHMPLELHDQLAGKPAGTVTRVFGEASEYRVLIRC